MKWFSWYFKTNLLLRIFIGLAAGAVAGLVFKDSIMVVEPFGDIFIRLIKMIVIPIVLSSLIIGASSISPSQLGKLGVKALVIFMLTSVFAVFIGLLTGNIMKPGIGLNLGSAKGASFEVERLSLYDTFIKIIPENPFKAISEGDILAIIFFAVLFGIGISMLKNNSDKRLKEAGELIYNFFDGVTEVLYLFVHWIMQYAPIGVFALIAVVFGQQGKETLLSLGKLILAIYIGYVLHLILVYGGILVSSGFSLKKFIKGSQESIIMAFVTRSSSGVLPITMQNADENLGIKKSIYSFTLPIGTTINMDGTAIYHGICAIFIGYAIGSPLDLSQQIIVLITAVLSSIGTVGVTGAGPIILLMVLQSVGISLESGSAAALAYTMILGIDAIVDMGRTAVNVTGNLAVTAYIAKTEKAINLDKLKK